MLEIPGKGVTGYALTNLEWSGEGSYNTGKRRVRPWMTFLTRAGTRNVPVEGCSSQAVTWTAIRVKFLHMHVWDTVVILE